MNWLCSGYWRFHDRRKWIYYELVLRKRDTPCHSFFLETDRQDISGYRCMSCDRICCQCIPFATRGNRVFRSKGSNVYNTVYGNDICLCYESDGTRENPGCIKKIAYSINVSLARQETVPWFYKQTCWFVKHMLHCA